MRKSLTHLFFNKLDGRELELQVSLTSGAVSVALVYFRPDQLPEILISDFKDTALLEDPTPEVLQEQVLKELDALLESFTKELGSMYEIEELFTDHQIIHSIAVSLNPLWTNSEVITFQKEFEKSTVVTNEDIAPKEVSEVEGLIDIRIIDTKANGYRVDPETVVGVETTKLESQIKRTMLIPSLRERITDTITKHVMADARDDIAFVPFTTAALQVMQELYGIHDQFSLLFFDDENTTILSRDRNFFLTLREINYGRSELIRQVSKEPYAPGLAYARDIVDMYYQGALQDDLSNQINSMLSIESRVLANLVANEENPIPTPLYVLTDDIGIEFIEKHASEHFEVSNTNMVMVEDFKDSVTYSHPERQPSVEAHLFAFFRSLQHK